LNLGVIVDDQVVCDKKILYGRWGMESIMMRNRYIRRPSTSTRLRRASRTGAGIRAVIMRQIAICLLLLMVIVIFRSINISATNYITDKIRSALEHNVELKSIFTTIEKFAADIRDSISLNTEVNTTPHDSDTTDGLEALAGPADKDAANSKSASDTDNEQDANITRTDTATLSVEESTRDDGEVSDNSSDRKIEASSSIDNGSEIGQYEEQEAIVHEKSVLSASTESQNYHAAGMLIPVNGTLGTMFGEMTDEITGVSKMHNGIDINVRQKSRIIAVLDGKVTETGSSPAYGNYIKIDHSGGLKTVYGNCSSIIAAKGENVKKGDTVAVIGDTETSAGSHLHFEVWVNGAAADPLEFISVPVR